MKPIIRPTETWQNITQALDALETAYQLGCPLAILYNRLFVAVADVARGTVFMIQLVNGKVETPRMATERLWRLGCELRVRGMGQARRELEAVGCDPETAAEREARFAQHREYEAKKTARAEEEAARAALKKLNLSPKPSTTPAVKLESRTLTCEELFSIRKMKDGPEKSTMLQGLANRTLIPPGKDAVDAYKAELIASGEWTDKDEQSCLSPQERRRMKQRRSRARKAAARKAAQEPETPEEESGEHPAA